jgi:thiol-disulfide isomerase/thioredoxin
MKKLFLISASFCLTAFAATAQNRSIAFEQTRVWQQVVEKARAEKKLIFVDCYTDWCGPCKLLAGNVFTLDHVADFFNSNFVNAKFEMEKDADGIANKAAWAVNAYPTLLFIDPASGEVIHRLVGAGQPDWLIEGAKAAMDPAKNLGGMIARYRAGERSPEFMVAYLKALSSGLMKAEQERVVGEYLGGMNADRLATPENWELIRMHVSDPRSALIGAVLADPEKFYAIEGVGREAVDRHLTAILMGGATVFTSRKVPFDKARYHEASAWYATIGHPAAEPARFYLATVGKADAGDWAGVLADVKRVAADNRILGQGFVSGFEFAFIPILGKSGDRAIVDEAVALLDGRMEGADLYAKPHILDMKSELLGNMGDRAAADEAATRADGFRKQIQDEIDSRNARSR